MQFLMAEFIERTADNVDWITHMKTKPMWGGSHKTQSNEFFKLETDPKPHFVSCTLDYPPILYKMIDEIMANAIDHHGTYPDLVTRLDVQVTTDSITIKNNGPGIPVKQVMTAAGIEMYQPQMIASVQYSGDNLKDSGVNIKGGTNGIGLKLAAVLSARLTLETLDDKRSLHYTQNFIDGLGKIEPPVIKSSKKAGYTAITCVPNFAAFKLEADKFAPTLHQLAEIRAWQAAAYTECPTYFNGVKIPIKSFVDYCGMFTDNPIIHCVARNKSAPDVYPWDICAALSGGRAQTVAFVNGIYVVDGGTFIKYILDAFIAACKPKLEKKLSASGVKFNKNYIINNLVIFFRGKIPSPNFSSQAKERVTDPASKYAGYELPVDFTNALYAQIEDLIISQTISSVIGEAKTRTTRDKIMVDKYEEATYARDKKRCLECGLLIAEGDSAMGTVRKGLLDKKTESERFNLEWFGIFSIKGVPVNALKESIEDARFKAQPAKPTQKATKKTTQAAIQDCDAQDDNPQETQKKETHKKQPSKKETHKQESQIKGHVQRLPKKKLCENERFSSLIKVLNLDWHKSYEQDTEFKTLRYGFIVAVTDQDLDGFNIFGLLATFIMTYWPHLIKRGFVRRLNTPIIRIYPKSRALLAYEFYTEEEAAQWISTHDTSKYKKPVYYKGLATHGQTPGEVTQTFRAVDKKICTFVLDAQAISAMYTYYGEDPDTRKAVLVTPVNRTVPAEPQRPALSWHFETNTKEYQLDNIKRKLPDIIDGLVDSRRKVLYTALSHGQEQMRVSVLAGYVTAETLYHHGEQSLYGCITRLAQGGIGARNLPLLMPLGQFGTRAAGYKDPGAPRYIFTTLNHRLTNLLFPKRDEFILKYRLEDGKRYEPEYYVPILPYGLLESESMPASGWVVHTNARHIDDVIENIKARIAGAPQCGKLRPWLRGFHGKVKKHAGKTYTIGRYEYNEAQNTVHITELPHGKFSKLYLGMGKDALSGILVDKLLVEDADDRSTDETIDITLYLKPEAYDTLTAADSGYGNAAFDCFIDYFELKAVLNDKINLINQGAVMECISYEQAFDVWFEERKQLYIARVSRDIILTELEIAMLENIQRFSSNYTAYKFNNKMPETEMHAILAREKYLKFDAHLLKNPKFTNVNDLRELITQHASYDYLCLMNFREISAAYFDKRAAELEKLRARLVELNKPGPFLGAAVWLAELAAITKIITDGLASGWFFGEGDYRYA